MSFYRQLDEDRFEATPYTTGPWDVAAQHAGPPAALLGHAIERHPRSAGLRVTRLTYDIVRPVPIATLVVATRVIRAGRSVAELEAELGPDGGPVAMRVKALLIRVADGSAPAVPDDPPPGAPETAQPAPFFPVPYDVGYHTAMECRFTAGSFLAPGPATGWMRMRVPLIDGEEPSPLTRVLVAADSGNGISSVLDWREHSFVNADLSVHLHRYPAGEWVCLDARTVIDADGIGMAYSGLYDEQSGLGRAAQSLLVAAR